MSAQEGAGVVVSPLPASQEGPVGTPLRRGGGIVAAHPSAHQEGDGSPCSQADGGTVQSRQTTSSKVTALPVDRPRGSITGSYKVEPAKEKDGSVLSMDDAGRSAILKSIGAEIVNLDTPGGLKPVRYQDIP